VGFVDTLDRTQRKRSWLGFPIATIFKFVDDQGPYLAAIITYYGCWRSSRCCSSR
jgi:uncharacterized BrkB/YihY/UPF0761 family membrane protein